MLLIDQALEATEIVNVEPRHLSALKRAYAKAVKFELAPDFAAAAEQLAEDFRNVKNALPYCRLPFPTTWIEVAQLHRPLFCASPIHVPEVQRIPIRVGFLLTSIPDHPSIAAHQFWTLRGDDERVQASHMAMLFDPTLANAAEEVKTLDRTRLLRIEESENWKKADADTRRILSNVIVPMPAFYVDDLLGRLWLDKSEYGQLSFELGAADWSGESSYLLAALALMNTLNATEQKEVDRSIINKRRRRLNKAPLNNHYVLSISPRIKKSMREGGKGASGADIRGHLCRGHFKVRKTGVYWWRAHTRGHGVEIEKSYRVT